MVEQSAVFKPRNGKTVCRTYAARNIRYDDCISILNALLTYMIWPREVYAIFPLHSHIPDLPELNNQNIFSCFELDYITIIAKRFIFQN